MDSRLHSLLYCTVYVLDFLVVFFIFLKKSTILHIHPAVTFRQTDQICYCQLKLPIGARSDISPLAPWLAVMHRGVEKLPP